MRLDHHIMQGISVRLVLGWKIQLNSLVNVSYQDQYKLLN